jgi:hypothetical protein
MKMNKKKKPNEMKKKENNNNDCSIEIKYGDNEEMKKILKKNNKMK